MQEWEYQTVEVVDSERAGFVPRLEVFRVNNQGMGKLVKKGSGLLGVDEYAYPDLHSYLATAGKEGWEVAGLSPTSGRGESGGAITFVVILKRPA